MKYTGKILQFVISYLYITKFNKYERSSMTKKEMIIDLNNFVKSKLPVIEKEIAALFASKLLYNTRIVIKHDGDPPWDRSGRAVNTYQEFDINDYQYVADFLREYNGQKDASYVSGHGFYHKTFEDEFHDKILELWVDCLKKYFEILKKDNKKSLINILNIDEEELNGDYYIWDPFYEIIVDQIDLQYYVILEKISKIKAKSFFKKGEFLAKLKNKKLHEKFKKQKEIRKKEQKHSEELFKQFKSYFKETYNKDFRNEKIVSLHYKSYFKEFLDNNFTREEQKLLVTFKHLSVSNSVRHKILYD